MVGGVGDSTRLCEEREKMKVEEKMERKKEWENEVGACLGMNSKRMGAMWHAPLLQNTT